MNLSENALVARGWSQFWQITVLVIGVSLAVRYGCRARPHLAFALWMLVIVKCLTPPLWSSPTSVFSWIQLRETTAPVTSDRFGFHKTPQTDRAEHSLPIDEQQSRLGVPSPENVTYPIPSDNSGSQREFVTTALVVIWIMGVVGISGVLVAKWLSNRRLLRRSITPPDPQFLTMAHELARLLGLRRKVRLVVTSNSIGPAAAGLFRPTIFVPECILRERSPAEIQPILAHELIHIRRGDTVFGALQVFAQLIWWFHPLVWWANRQASRESERCCDEAVIAILDCKPSVYARCLLSVLETKQQFQPMFGNPGVRPAQVTSNRLEHIMKRAPRFHAKTPRWCWAVVATAAAVLLPGGALISDSKQSAVADAVQDAAQTNLAENFIEIAAVEPTVQSTTENRRGEYTVFPVTTELQRRILGDHGRTRDIKDAKAFVVINGLSVMNEAGAIDAAALNLTELRKSLAPFADREQGTVFFETMYRLPSSVDGEDLLMWALKGFGRHAGFRQAFAKSSFLGERFEWDELVAAIDKKVAGAPDGKEPGFGNELVKVYPVRTILSRYMIHNYADCLVDVLEPMDGSGDSVLRPEIQQAIIRYVAEAKPAHRDWMRLNVRSTTRDIRKPNDERLFQEREKLAEVFGFKQISFLHYHLTADSNP